MTPYTQVLQPICSAAFLSIINAIKKGAKYTRTRRPVQLIHNEQYENRSEACQREAAIKKLSRQQKQLLIKSKKDE